MTTMVRKVTRVRGFITAIDLPVRLELGLELRRRRKTDGAELILLGIVMKDDRCRGTRLRLGTRTVGGLAIGEHTAAAERGGVEGSRIAPRLAPCHLHVGERGIGGLGIAHSRHPVRAELGGDPPAAWAESRDVQRDSIAS